MSRRAAKNLANRIELSSGTRLADMRETTDLVHGTAYEEGARLPRDPWHRPTAEEAESLIVTEVPRNMATTVAIVKLPGEFSEDVRQSIRSGSPESLEVNLLRPLRTICELGEPLHCIGPNKQPGNPKTVTINREIGRYSACMSTLGTDVTLIHCTSRPIAFASTSGRTIVISCFCRFR